MPFEYSGSLQSGLVIRFASGGKLAIDRDTIDIIRQEIVQRSPVLMGASRKPLVQNSVGEALKVRYRKSPQLMSYVLPLLVEAGFCKVSVKKPFLIEKL
jgi:hypothetical protein